MAIFAHLMFYRLVSVVSALSAVFIGLLTMVNTREDIIYKR